MFLDQFLFELSCKNTHMETHTHTHTHIRTYTKALTSTLTIIKNITYGTKFETLSIKIARALQYMKIVTIHVYVSD